MTLCILVVSNMAAAAAVVSFTINPSCLVLLLNSEVEVEVKCFKIYLQNDTSLGSYTKAV